jgi:hypothetical protein
MVNEVGTTSGTVEAAGPERCLRRLATVFDRVIELPLSADAAVKIFKFAHFYCFLASSTGLADDQVQPHFIRYDPNTIKLIVVSLL